MDKSYLLHNLKIVDNAEEDHGILDLEFQNIRYENRDLIADVIETARYVGEANPGTFITKHNDVSLTGAGGGGGMILLKESNYRIASGDTDTNLVDIDSFDVTNDMIDEDLKNNGLVIFNVERSSKIADAYYGTTLIIPIMNSQTSFAPGYTFKIKPGTNYRGWLNDGRIQDGIYPHTISCNYAEHKISITIGKRYNAPRTPNWDNATYNVKVYLTKI